MSPPRVKPQADPYVDPVSKTNNPLGAGGEPDCGIAF